MAGKLDPHATVYGFDLIRKAIEAKNFEGKDRYGVPILKCDAVVAGKVEVGAGPPHTQYDNAGNAYTSLYLESAVVKWTLGPPFWWLTCRFERGGRYAVTPSSSCSREADENWRPPDSVTSSPHRRFRGVSSA